MIFRKMAAVLTLSAAMTGVGVAQTAMQCNKDTQRQLKADEKANKSQAQADKAERKALNSHKVKKAIKKQDKATADANRANYPDTQPQ